MKRTGRGRDEYLARIEEYIVQRRLSPLLLSPKEWAVAQRWKEDEIPLLVVFRGIDRAARSLVSSATEFEKLRLSLAYCDKPVRAAFKSFLKARSLFFDEKDRCADLSSLAGADDADTFYVLNRLETLWQRVLELASDPRFTDHKESIAEVAERIKRLLKSVRRSRRAGWLEKLQTKLAALDRKLVDVAKEVIPQDRYKDIQAQVREQTGECGSEPGVQSMVEDYLLQRAIREEMGLPAIGLFDL